mmetsp:Transcript_68581/g.135622  ORF Transcript_68581/g.135622 Transcript_68581/m.135622 type:complete len:244 (-) Transcript_68581:99-830(-)|eukprot:CAMPEP_0172665840 /NCGR_PEP_ID=MMETSP1074-20121228/7479_1 /TAXON_ID=2916 /ORGANISM="Ceratium fusus, Strain PA161109" /LENGTH=243 /DNA_ID=CAMNT_0013482183 /DNA_START=78 /DNA_END=809 /DNA_ORIENTATION=+
MPTQLFVSVTPSIRQFLETVTNEARSDQTPDANAESVDIDELYRLAAEHGERSGTNVCVHELLAGAEIVERRQANGPALSDLERLRLESEERKYQHMVRGVAPLTGARAKQQQGAASGFSFATNFATQVAVAFIGAFALGFYFVETFVAPGNFEAKVIAGAFCSFGTLLLETLLLVVHSQKEEMIEQKRQEQEEREKKKTAVRRHPAEQSVNKHVTQIRTSDGQGKEETEVNPPKPAREKKED